MAKVIRYSVLRESHTGDNNFLIHRPYIFSNPFTHIKNKETKAKFVAPTRDKAIELYDEYFDVMLKTSPKFKEEWDKLYNAYKTFDEIYIGCYCNTNETCHGDVIIEKLKKRRVRDLLKDYHGKTDSKTLELS